MDFDNQPVSSLEAARLSLARLGIVDPGEVDRVMQVASRVSATTLGASRVGIWLFDDFAALRCVSQYVPARDLDEPGGVLRVEDYPQYFAAIRSRRALAAEDAQNDPRTRELSEYLAHGDVGSLLDVPIYANGEVIGILCFEHIGSPRTWEKRDVDFAISMGDMLSSLFEHARLLASEAAARRALQKAAHAERMDALARLSLGVIHDVNNLLTVVSAHASVLEPKAAAREVIEQCEAAGRLTRQLLVFARGGSSEGVAVDVAQVLRDFESVLRAALGSMIELDVTIEEPAMVSTSRSDLEQILLNLVMNAQQAMRDGSGKVTVSVRVDDDHVVIAVDDDGMGMDEATQQRAFEPFFTTRVDRGGTGMGLATVYGILRRAGGDVVLESRVDHGTKVSLRFPHAPSGRALTGLSRGLAAETAGVVPVALSTAAGLGLRGDPALARRRREVVPGDPRPQGLGRGRIAPVPGDPRHARRRRCGGLFGQGRRRTGRHFDDAPRASGASTACAEQHEGAERRRDDRCRERAGSRCSGCARRGTAAATAGRTHAPPSHAPESARRRNRRRGGRPPRFRVSPGGPCSTTWASHD